MRGHDRIDEEGQKLNVVLRSLARGQQIDARIRAQRPVAVLARSVDAQKRLFVEQHSQFVPECDASHDGHQQRVVVDGDVRFLEHRSAFELVGRHFVVPGLERNAEPVGLLLEVLHEFEYPVGDRSEIVVVELLVLGRDMAHQRPSGLHQVGTGQKQRLVHQKILLFPAQRHVHLVDVLVEILAYLDGSLVDRRQRFQQRGFEVERFARIGDEYAGNTERLVEYECRRGGVPCRVAPGLERIAQPSVREARCVGLLLYEQLALERFERASAPHGLEKGVVLFGRRVVQRLEPVRVVGRAFLHGPRLHALRDLVGDLAVDPTSFVDRVA